MNNFKITKTILENINEQNDRINECVDIVNGYTTDEETRVNQELQRQENELRREEQYNNNENRFTVINEQLKTKANESEVVKKGNGTLSDFDEPTRLAIQGISSSSINAVLGDKNVTPENTNFINIGKNLFDRNNNPMLNGIAITEDKNVSNVEQLNTSNWIHLEVGKTYTISSMSSTFFYIVEYDNKEVIEVGKPTNFAKFTNTASLTPSNNYTFVAEHNYCVIVYWHQNVQGDLQIEVGENRSEYEEFKYILSDKIIVNDKKIGKDESIFDLAYIKNGELICNNNFANGDGTVAKYNCIDLKEPSKKVMCKAKFIGETSVALISMKNGYRKVEDVTNKSIHVVFGKTSVLVGYFVDNILTDVENVQYAQLTDDIEYNFGYELNGDNLTVYLPDGTNRVFNNSNWQQCNGQYVCWEHFTMNATSTNKNAVAKFTEFYAEGINGEICIDNFNRFDGCICNAPTGQTYSQFRNY